MVIAWRRTHTAGKVGHPGLPTHALQEQCPNAAKDHSISDFLKVHITSRSAESKALGEETPFSTWENFLVRG
jgi:hypothetical protein